jgi:dTDP-4-dehydrorhamnose reductase
LNDDVPHTIWVTGAGGLIGSQICATARDYVTDGSVLALTRRDLDLTDSAAVRAFFQQRPPELIIHCAAMSRSPDCQAQPDLARKVNVEATRLLADLAAGTRFVFLSTDLIFDGRDGNYDEQAEVNPLSMYAETKVHAEAVVLRNSRAVVIRTSLNGGTSPTGNRGFNEEMRNAWKRGQSLKLFADEFRSPIPAEATARATWELSLSNKATGIYHVAGTEKLSRWEIGQLVAARWPNLNPHLEPASIKDYNGPPRPPDTSLNCSKAQTILRCRLPGLTAWLNAHPEIEF